MHALRQKCRPKHQVLILNCFPRTTKGAVDVKPNSSELSYLLYYATTRRSKVQKVGAFLEKKTASDVWRARIGNVQVTLQILTALIEKAPRDLPLYAPYLLKILNLILRSHDITMVEASIPTFEAFCEHHDAATLSADQEYLHQYKDVVQIYATFASTAPQPAKLQPSAPISMKWRSVGLRAIKAITSSEALASVAGRQFDAIMPVLLENVWTENPEYLEMLHARSKEEEADGEKLRRRTSIGTVGTTDTSEGNPAALVGTTADADRVAEEAIGLLALQCLKQLFEVNNRSQIRGATLATLKFILERVREGKNVLRLHATTGNDSGWASTMFEMITRWTPVQDRYVILVTAMDSLIRNPPAEENMAHQLVLATMIGSLLRSNINLIGLSVMDVLLGLIQHVLRVLQLGGVNPHPQQRDIVDEKSLSESSKSPSPTTSTTGQGLTERATTPSATRKDLLAQLQRCIGDLGTHIYYADQISDMITAILLRLKPSPHSSVPSPAGAIEDPEAASNAISASANLVEDPNTDGFFSLDTAKITALKAIKDVIIVASYRGKVAGAGLLARNRVGPQTWEGTQWLLRDGDGRVRMAYVDALLTWLEKEMTKSDLRAFDDSPPPVKGRNGSVVSMSKRAVSNATRRETCHKTHRTSFLQLLHLAIYENAHQYVDSEPDMVLLHLLLTTLVNKLGVNAVKCGLPMIVRLQEDIQDVESPIAKFRIGAVCHGYFWALCEKFGFEASEIAANIQTEITRRRTKGLWVDMIRMPPVPLSQIPPLGLTTVESRIPLHELESESLKPFDDREAMVELISLSYSKSMASPPNSPPTSPGRSFSHPILTGSETDPVEELPIPIATKEQMLSEWSKEEVMQLANDASKAASMNGSRGTNGPAPRNFLAVGGMNNSNGVNGGSHAPSPQHASYRSKPPSLAYGLVGSMGIINKNRKPGHEGSPTPASESSRTSVTRVDQLKRVLSGQQHGTRDGRTEHSDSSSDSMVSYDYTVSEVSFNPRGASAAGRSTRASQDNPRSGSARSSQDVTRPRSRPSTGRKSESSDHFNPLTSHPVDGLDEIALAESLDNPDEARDSVPPVPPLPQHLISSTSPTTKPASSGSGVTNHDYGSSEMGRSRSMKKGNRSNRGEHSSSWGSNATPALDLQSLLQNIPSGGDHKGLVSKAQPPY